MPEPAPLLVPTRSKKKLYEELDIIFDARFPLKEKNTATVSEELMLGWCFLLHRTRLFKMAGSMTMRNFCWSKTIGWHKITRKIWNHIICIHIVLWRCFPPKFIDTAIGLWIVDLDCAACDSWLKSCMPYIPWFSGQAKASQAKRVNVTFLHAILHKSSWNVKFLSHGNLMCPCIFNTHPMTYVWMEQPSICWNHSWFNVTLASR